MKRLTGLRDGLARNFTVLRIFDMSAQGCEHTPSYEPVRLNVVYDHWGNQMPGEEEQAGGMPATVADYRRGPWYSRSRTPARVCGFFRYPSGRASVF